MGEAPGAKVHLRGSGRGRAGRTSAVSRDSRHTRRCRREARRSPGRQCMGRGRCAHMHRDRDADLRPLATVDGEKLVALRLAAADVPLACGPHRRGFGGIWRSVEEEIEAKGQGEGLRSPNSVWNSKWVASAGERVVACHTTMQWGQWTALFSPPITPHREKDAPQVSPLAV